MARKKEDFVRDGEGTRFTSERQPANRGRKPNIYKQAAEASGFSKQDMENVLLMLMGMSREQMKKDIIDNQDTPIWILNIARAIYHDTGQSNIKTLSTIFDRIYGKPRQEIAASQEVDIRKEDTMSREEMIKEIERLQATRKE